MNTNRFKNYDPGVRQLVLSFEDDGERCRTFFDVEELEIIADYYLEVCDMDGLEAAVKLGERLYPHNNDIRLRRAQMFGVQGLYEQALGLLKQLERDEPSNTDVCYSLATLYSATGNAKESINYYLRAAADGYELGMVYGNVADEYMKLGNTVQAVRYYLKSVDDNSDEHRSLRALAHIWFHQGRIGQAVQYFSEHVADHPYCKTAWYCLGCSYMQSGRDNVAKAVDAFKYALAIDGRFEDASYELAEAYVKQGDLPHAVQALREVLDYTDTRDLVFRAIGNLYMRAGNYHTAYTYYRDALKENGDEGFAWNDLGHCCEKLGYVSEAEEHYRRAIHLCPDYDDLWLDLADMYITELRFSEAAALLDSIRMTVDNRFHFDIRLMYCYYRLGRRNKLFSLLAEDAALGAYRFSDLLIYYPDMSQDTDLVTVIREYDRNCKFINPF